LLVLEMLAEEIFSLSEKVQQLRQEFGHFIINVLTDIAI